MSLKYGLLPGMLTIKENTKTQDEMGTYYDGSYRGNDVIFQDVATCHTATFLSATNFQNPTTAGKELHEVSNRAEKTRGPRTSRRSKKTMHPDQAASTSDGGGSIETTATAFGPSVVAQTNPSPLISVR
jgi:hypothetical protein